MLIVLDVGNTNAVLGVYRGDELVRHFRLSSDAQRTGDEYGAAVRELLGAELEREAVEGVIVSSVVPPLHHTLEVFSRDYLGREPLFVEPGVKTGLPIRYDNPAEVGADRIVNAVAARAGYGYPVIVVDFGTATTFDVVNNKGEYVGGIIAPGIRISSEALFAHASRLYRVDIRRPDTLVGRNTVGAMQSGIYFGSLGLVDGILERLHAEMPDLKTVVATGGEAKLIADGSRYIETVDSNLTLTGLKLIWDLNQ